MPIFPQYINLQNCLRERERESRKIESFHLNLSTYISMFSEFQNELPFLFNITMSQIVCSRYLSVCGDDLDLALRDNGGDGHKPIQPRSQNQKGSSLG